MAYRPVCEMPMSPQKPNNKKTNLTTATFANNGYMLIDESSVYDDSRHVKFLKKKELQRRTPQTTEGLPEPKKDNDVLFLGIGMCGCLLLLMFTINVLLPWWNGLQAQWYYGDAHITHYDLPEHHFVGEVYHGFVVVYDISEGHPEKSLIFMLQSSNDDTVVNFETHDANNDGIPDVTVSTEGSLIGVTLHGTKDNTFSKTPLEAK